MGASKEQAKRLADQILQLPNKKVKVDVELTPAERKLKQFKRLYDSLRDKHITITATYERNGFHVNRDGHLGGTLSQYASGGPVRGRGTGTSDDIPAWLSNGEHVWTAREVATAIAL